MARDKHVRSVLPREPIHSIVEPVARFMHVEAAGGVVLLVCTVTALVLANSPVSGAYLGFWKAQLGFRVGSFEMLHSLKHWINDGLMAIFFFVIGLEVKRELVIGELRDIRRAALPIAAALGGMVVPAGIYLLLQGDGPAMRGWGIPMATDIAFVVGCMALLGSRVPPVLRITMLSLAIVDDIGAILVIAIGYTESLSWTALGLGAAGILVIALLERLGVRSLLLYTVLGVLVWLAFHESGVHATIAGVILGLQTPARPYLEAGVVGNLMARASEVFHGEGFTDLAHRADKIRSLAHVARESVAPLDLLEATLHPWVGFVIMPVFALANAGVPLRLADLGHPVAMAVAAGLVIGKPVGILACSWLVVRFVLKRLPEGITWSTLVGGGFLAGIGFTMALFIADLALAPPVLDAAKVGVLSASAIAALIGFAILAVRLPRT